MPAETRAFNGPLGWAAGLLGTLIGVVFLLWLALYVTKGRFLEASFEEYASEALGRPVAVAGDFQLYLNPHIRFYAEDLTAENPDWAETERLADAEKIDLSIHVFRLIFGRLLIRSANMDQATFALEWNEDGSANNWTFGAGDETGRPFSLPAIRRASVTGTSVSYRDPVLELSMAIDIEPIRMRGSDIAGGIGFSGDGMSRGVPFTLSGSLESPDATLGGGENQLVARVDVGASRIDVTGTLPGATELEGSDLEVRARGSNMQDALQLIAITVPATRTYDVGGDLTKTGEEWRFTDIAGTFGDSDLAGRMTIRTGGARVFVDAGLSSRTLDIIDIAPWIGLDPNRIAGEGAAGAVVEVGGTPRIIPDAPLNAEGLARLDAKVELSADRVRTGTIPIADFRLVLDLEDRHLRLTPVTFDLAGGTLTMNIDLDAAQRPVKTVYDITLSPVRLAALLKGFELEETGTTGTVRGRLDLSGTGDTMHESLASANGRMAFVLPQGALRIGSSELVELDVGDFLEAAVSDDLEDPANLRCGLIAFTFEDGIAKTDPIF
ncbi:MAG: AsmA family protein, partial [Pseudomonadota bacterium]